MPPGDWSEATRAWWHTWATSPQSSAFTGTDWQRLSMLIFLVEQFFAAPDRHVMAEVRLSEAKLGATVEDRARTRMTIEKPKPVRDTSAAYKHLEEA